MWIVCITSVRHVLTVNGYGGRQTKENEKSWCFKGWETLVVYLISLSKPFTISNILKGTESAHFVKRGTGIPERQNERPVPYLNKYDTLASYILVFLENYQFSLYKSTRTRTE